MADHRDPVTLVTAIYARNRDDVLGGRGRPVGYYLESLQRLSHLGAPWVIYTDPAHVQEIAAFVSARAIRAEVVPRPLALVPQADRITQVREHLGVRDLPYSDRCHVLCFAKVGWLAAEAAAPRFGSDEVYWIDAGLAHQGLFPERLFAAPERIFSPRVLSALRASDLTLVAHPLASTLQHDVSVDTMTVLAALSEPPRRHVVGGLFGGRRRHVMQLAIEFDDLHARMLSAGLLGTEENVLSLLATRHPDWAVHEFESWYHEDTEFLQVPPGTVSFHVLFERWAGLLNTSPESQVVTFTFPPLAHGGVGDPRVNARYDFDGDAVGRTPTSSS